MLLVKRARRVPILRSLRHRSFALIWLGQSLSRVGDAVLLVALPWLVYDLTGSAVAMSSVVVLQRVPTLLLLLLGGVAVDRLPRQQVMLASDAVQGLTVLLMAASIGSGHLQLWHLQVMAVVFGAAAAFFRPALSSIIPQLVPKDELVSANSLVSASRSLAQVVGPLLGAGLVASAGMATAFAFDAATFGVSVLCLLAVPTVATASGVKRGKIWREVADGFRVVGSTTWLWFGIVGPAAGNALNAGAFTVVLPLFVREQLGGDIGALGAVQSAMSAGVIVGLFALGQHGMPRLRGIWYYGAILALGMAVAELGLSRTLPEAVVVALLVGLSLAIANVVWDASLQQLVAPELLGRVNSIDMLGSLALTPVGVALAGVAAEASGSAPVFIAAGAVSFVIALVGLLTPRARRFG